MVAALAFLLAGQNPNSPDVVLPPGWKAELGRRNDHTLGLLVGPKGEEIEYPAYGGTGDLAAELRGADPRGIFTYAVIGGRRVDVAIASDGRLTVSYPQAWPPSHSSFAPFDFQTLVSSARDAATRLLIVLTRIEAYKGPGYGSVHTSRPPQTMGGMGQGNSLGLMSTPRGYVLNTSSPGPSLVARFSGSGKPTVEAHRLEAEGDLPPFSGSAAPARWEEVRTIHGREFHIREGERGGLAAWIARTEGSSKKDLGLAFTTEETSARAAVVLVLMSLSTISVE